MAPTKNASAASAPFAGEELDDDSEIHWLQNPHTNSITSNSDSNTVNDPTLLPLLTDLSTLDSTLTCPICHVTPLTIPVTLTPCQHTFCSLCLQSNFHSQKRAANGTNTKTSCPKCRVRCHEDRDVVPNAVLEGVCRLWKGVRGEVRDRLWSSSSASLSVGSGGGKNESSSAASANGSRDGANDAEDGGGKKRAASSVTASSASASSASSSASASISAGGRKRPRRGTSSRRTTTDTTDNTDDEDDNDDDMPSSDEDSAYSDTDDVEFVPKSGRGGGNSGDGKRKAPAPSASSASSTGKAAATATAAASKVKSKAAKSYPSDADYLTSIRSTIDPHTLDRTQSLPGNLTHVKKPKMIQMLSAYHLSTSTHATGGSGSSGLEVLKDRYRAFRMLYNAQCPSTHPAPIAQLVEQVHAEERAREKERRMALMNGSGRVSEEMRRLNAKWNEEGKKVDGGDGGGGEVRAAGIPDKMKTGFAALVAEGKRRCKEQGWRMGDKEEQEDAGAGDSSSSKKKRKWEEDDKQRLGAQEEEKKEDDADTADGAEEPIVLDDGSDDEDEDDDRKPSAAEAARAAEDGINGPQDSTNDARNGDDDREAQISRSPSSESPRTVRASSSSDGLVGPTTASSAPASAKKSLSSAKKSKPSPRQAHQKTPQPQQYRPASVDTRSIRNNSTPSTIGPWSCGACTYYNEINIGSRDKCEMCDTPRPRPSSRPSRNVGCFDC